MRSIYRYKWSYEDKIRLEGLFIADNEELKKVMGKTVPLSKYLPKYAGLIVKLGAKDFQPITSNESAIKVFDYFKLETGFNPLNYL